MSIDIVLMRYTGQFSNINGNVNIADYYRCGCRWSMVFLNHSNIPWKKRATPNTIKRRTRQRPNKKKSVHLLHTHREIVVTITIRRKMHAQNARCKRLNQPTIVIYFSISLIRSFVSTILLFPFYPKSINNNDDTERGRCSHSTLIFHGQYGVYAHFSTHFLFFHLNE